MCTPTEFPEGCCCWSGTSLRKPLFRGISSHQFQLPSQHDPSFSPSPGELLRKLTQEGSPKGLCPPGTPGSQAEKASVSYLQTGGFKGRGRLLLSTLDTQAALQTSPQQVLSKPQQVTSPSLGGSWLLEPLCVWVGVENSGSPWLLYKAEMLENLSSQEPHP